MAPKASSYPPQAPDCLIWELVRKNHAFLKKSGSKTFSLEKFNLLGKHTPKLTGFSESCVMDLLLNSNGSAIIHKTLDLKNTRRPYGRTQVEKYAKSLGNLPALRNRIKKLRPDLTKHALLKFAKLTKAKPSKKTQQTHK